MEVPMTPTGASHQSLMREHVPLRAGLPKSLLPKGQGEGRLIELMRQQGLTTANIKEILGQGFAKKAKQSGSRSEAFLQVLSMPIYRADTFIWNVEPKRRRQRFAGHSPELVLLTHLAPDWKGLDFDEEMLESACDGSWKLIRAHFENALTPSVRGDALRVFMLWPGLLATLRTAGRPESPDQESSSHLAFVLSTIAYSDWFVRKAIELAPSLDDDLGHLLTKNTCATNLDEGEDEADGEVDPPSSPDHAECWEQICEKLAELQPDSRGPANRELLVQLAELGIQATRLLDALPEERDTTESALREAVEKVAQQLQVLSIGQAQTWLGASEIGQVRARWKLAQSEVSDAESLAELLFDAIAAQDRMSIAISEMASAEKRAQEAGQREDELTEQLARDPPGVLQLQFRNRHRQAKQESVDADRKRDDAIMFVLAAASPRGASFDPATDYLAAATGLIEEPNHQASDRDATGPDIPAPVTVDLPPENLVPSAATVRDAPIVSDPPVPVSIPQEEPSAPIEELEPSGPFTDDAGIRCRPIWALLRQGRAALAWHFASVLRSTDSDLRPPPPELLRAVALAGGLVSSDGAVAMEIAETFASIDASWFEPGEAPDSWHAALNLLLLAATLRPMVLAPATGAASIAGYRHLDGRHAALLKLIHKVQDISEPMTGFSIGPTVLQSAADEAGLRAQLVRIANDAAQWLSGRAPNKRNKYAPASKVWLHWLKPGEAIHALIAPVAANDQAALSDVASALEQLSDYDAFLARIEDTDRRRLNRRGQDIIAGSLDQLWTATEEAISIAKKWLVAVRMLSESGGRLRSLVAQLQTAFETHSAEVRAELGRPWNDDGWGQVSAASQVLLAEVNAIDAMFKGMDDTLTSESSPREILARDLLLVPGILVGDGWAVNSAPLDVLEALTAWSSLPTDTEQAVSARISNGDIAGATLLVSRLDDTAQKSRVLEIERAREQWGKDLQKTVGRARRATEVGLAFGYLTDAERAASESELSAVEADIRETERFDVATLRIETVEERVEEYRQRRLQEASRDLDRQRASLSEEAASQVEAQLQKGDLHTFNELLQRVMAGASAWPERDLRRDAFREFYPALQTSLMGMLSKSSPQETAKTIRQGGSIGELSFELDGDETARGQSALVVELWAAASARQNVSRDNLRKILEAIGLPVLQLEPDRVNFRGQTAWALRTQSIEDREVCPVPFYGSRAQGRYRLVPVMKPITAEDLLQGLGEETQQVPTIVVLFARSQPGFWSSLARASKKQQRSCLVLDESMLLFLMAQRGQRLATWFNVALPFAYSEPYDASAGSVPPEMFYGRSEELARVTAHGDCYFIYGGRQLGKTALMRRAEKTFHDPASGHYAVWVDLLAQGIGERRPSSDIWATISEKLRELRIPELALPPVSGTKQASVDAFLSSLKTYLAPASGRRILLLLDEADRFFEQESRQSNGSYPETRRLKQLMDETERRFKVVFAGLHNVLRTATTSNQPLGHLNEAVQIGPLMSEREIRSAEDLITRPIEAAGFEFQDRSLVMRILGQTNYYPSLIQLYCTQLLRNLRESKFKHRDQSLPRFTIEEADIESVFSGRPLRDAIRSKFKLTLRLDERYEVIANSIGLEALTPGFDHATGLDWRRVRRDSATYWPEGFAKTSERDFLALLDEMVQLGVLRAAQIPDHFSLRNPNVLLLLGSKQEIENTLQAEREPSIEFESTIFRPALRGRLDDPARNPLTYRQLDDVMKQTSSVWLVATSAAAGGAHLVVGLQGHPGAVDNREVIVMHGLVDLKEFTQELDKTFKKRTPNAITLVLVPAELPWDGTWVANAQIKVRALTSSKSFVSVLFLSDPARLWSLSVNTPLHEPWLTVLPWDKPLVRKWLEELQLPGDSIDLIGNVTGYWGGLLESLARVKGGALDFQNSLERLSKQRQDSGWRTETLHRLTGGVAHVEPVMKALASLGDCVTASDIVDFEGLPVDLVDRTLRWAEPLGLVIRQPGSAWSLDPFMKSLLTGTEQ